MKYLLFSVFSILALLPITAIHGDFDESDVEYKDYFESMPLELIRTIGEYVNDRNIGGDSGIVLGAQFFDIENDRIEAVKFVILAHAIPTDGSLKDFKVSRVKSTSKEINKAVKKWLSNGGVKPSEDASEADQTAAKKKDARAKKAIGEMFAFVSRKENVLLHPSLSMGEAKSSNKKEGDAPTEEAPEPSDEEFLPALEFYSGALVSDDATDELPPTYSANFLAVFDTEELELIILIQGVGDE